jgi:protein-S-isoprenylcysteine O-methyltransferase Ste14
VVCLLPVFFMLHFWYIYSVKKFVGSRLVVKIIEEKIKLVSSSLQLLRWFACQYSNSTMKCGMVLGSTPPHTQLSAVLDWFSLAECLDAIVHLIGYCCLVPRSAASPQTQLDSSITC